MKLRRSVAAILFPQARRSRAAMEQTLSYLSDKVHQIEFYYEGEEHQAIARALEQSGLTSCFIGVIPSKEKQLSLCSLDPGHRTAAVDLMKQCVDTAYTLGTQRFMVCSGKYPATHSDVSASIDAFVQSMCEVIDYSEKKSGSQKLHFLLEPCDSHMDACHLLGSTAHSVEAVRRVQHSFPNFTLTMDTAHVAEEGEEFLEAMKLAKDYCDHVHFANCVIHDPSHPFYGDKHVDFDEPFSSFPYPVLEKILHSLDRTYDEGTLTVALESLCRGEDAFKNFEKIMQNMPWFFQR